MIKKMINCIKHPQKIIIFLGQRGFFSKIISDETFVKILFKQTLHYDLHINNPQTFNEKIQWQKLYDRNPIYPTLVDKYEVRKFIGEKVGEEYLIPIIGVWGRFDDINFGKLPKSFVIKCTHDSGGVVVVKDKEKADISRVKKKIEKSLKKNYYFQGREWAYKNVNPQIIIEEYMMDKEKKELIDYKLMVFNGKVKCSFTCSERFSKDGLKVTFFDQNWERMPFERHYPASKHYIDKPVNYKKMVEIAEKLSEGLTFARIDFYEANGQLYVGEITLYPGDGLEEFTPVEYDLILGKMLKLPTNTKNELV